MQDLSQFELTGECRAPRAGEWFLSNITGQPLHTHQDEPKHIRHIVRPREQGTNLDAAKKKAALALATFGELSAELMRRFEGENLSSFTIRDVTERSSQTEWRPEADAPNAEGAQGPFDQEAPGPQKPILGGTWFEIVTLEEDERLTEEDAREAALVILTQIALDEKLHFMDRMEAARTILQHGSYEL